MTRRRSMLPPESDAVKVPAVYGVAAPPRIRRGRRPTAELSAIRARVEGLMLQGLRAPAIHRALTGADGPNPIAVSERGVRDHMRAVERSWRERSSRETLEADRAKAVAYAEESIRVSVARSTLHAGTNVGVGYFNASLKAQERYARLRGLDAPVSQELSGRDGTALLVGLVPLADHPLEHLPPKELAEGYRRLAEIAESQADDEPGGP